MSVREIIKDFMRDITGWKAEDFQVEKPKNNQADYAISVFAAAKKSGRSAQTLAEEISAKLSAGKSEAIDRIEASGGYVNFFLSNKFLQSQLLNISKEENYGFNDSWKGKKVMVEYTDPNPFKLFHIGHLMSNTIGEAIARLYEASGASVIRANYQGDKGLHIAKAVWGMQWLPDENNRKKIPDENDDLNKKIEFLGEAYTFGALAYENQPDTKLAIEEINQKIYDHSDSEINKIYDLGKRWSLEYFEEQYKRLGTKFDKYFFESEVSDKGLEIVKAHKDIFTESERAIVFKGEDFGLHTRVFVNSKCLPTYEAKEIGLNKKKFELYPELGKSIIVTGNEIDEYFKVLLKVMELIIPEVASKTRHVGHGMMRLPSGKMSSRTGEVVTADSLIEQIKEKLKERENKEVTIDADTREAIAIGAIKYSILKQSPGKDIIFDFDKSLAVKGDSGPYLQYTFARLKAILTKSKEQGTGNREKKKSAVHCSLLTESSELNLVKHFLEFPEVIRESAEMITPQKLALYVFELAELVNNFYEKIRILDDDDEGRMAARLLLVKTAADILSRGLHILGIKTPERI